MLNSELWEVANGIIALLGAFIIAMVALYLVRNWRRTYHEPIRFITLAFALIILGHTIKDGSSYVARCCDVRPPDGLLIAAVILVAFGKLGSIKIWSPLKWGNWPWIVAIALVAVFLVISAVM